MAIQLSKEGTLSLEKGQKVNLAKENTGQQLNDVTIGLGWDAKKVEKKGLFGKVFGSGSKNIDLDASLIFYSDVKQPTEIVYFGHTDSSDGSASHAGDNLTGDGEGDDEQIFLKLNKVSPSVHHVAVIINSYSSQTFSEVENVFARLVDNSTGEEVVYYDMRTSAGLNTALFVGVFSRNGRNPAEGWSFRATEIPMNGKVAKENQFQIAQHI